MTEPDPRSAAPLVSFRDPAGIVLRTADQVFRVVTAGGAADLKAFLESPAGRRLMEAGDVVDTRPADRFAAARVLGRQEAACLAQGGSEPMVLEHECIAFPSFPYEWPPEMLHAAGLLTLDLARKLLSDGLGLKDASPYNVLFRGPVPVFIDVLSFERRDPDDPTWLPYAQFIRTFLLPLLANRRFGLPLDQLLITRRDGLEPGDLYRWAGPLDRISPGFLSLVSIPKWLESGHKQDDTGIYRRKQSGNPEKARFILESLLDRLRRALMRLSPPAGRTSVWSDYAVSNNNYAPEHARAKSRFVEACMDELRPRRVLDVGCNTGHFSAIAAERGAGVVAIDYDPVVVGRVWRAARERKLDILPLVVDLTRPTPAVGWLNRECPSFLERARGRFDCVFLLAVIHHMLVTERVPLAGILQLAADLTRDAAVIEFIAPDDSMFRRLVRGREELHEDLNHAVFEQACAAHFDITRVQHVDGTSRWLYLLRKRQPVVA